jgi:DNA repair protein RecO
MAYVTAVLYHREARDLQLLTQCDLHEIMPGLSGDLQRLSAGMVAVELVDTLTRPGESHPVLFGVLLDTLRAISGATKNATNALYFFEVRFLDILGFRPGLARCAVCGGAVEVAEGYQAAGPAHIGHAGVVCAVCSARHHGLLEITPPALRILQRLQELPVAEASTRISMTESVRAELGNVLWRLFQWNIDGMSRLRSREVFASLDSGGLLPR